MPAKKYVVKLTPEERSDLLQFTNTGKAAAYKIKRAQILLRADEVQADGSWTDRAISKALDVSVPTIERVRRCFVEEGLESALCRKCQPQRPDARRLDGEQEAHLIALACSEAPPGEARWSLRLLAERMVELEYVETLCHETVRRVLKKTNLNLG